MRSGLCWSPICPFRLRGGPVRGRTTGRWSTGCLADPDRVAVAGPSGVLWVLEDRVQPASPLVSGGTWDAVLRELQRGCDVGEDTWVVSIDSTVIRAHHHAAGAR